jgi:hypothetical protein
VSHERFLRYPRAAATTLSELGGSSQLSRRWWGATDVNVFPAVALLMRRQLRFRAAIPGRRVDLTIKADQLIFVTPGIR